MQCSRKRMFFLRNCPESIKYLYGGRGWTLIHSWATISLFLVPSILSFFSPFLCFLSTKYFVFNFSPLITFLVIHPFVIPESSKDHEWKPVRCLSGPHHLGRIEQFLSSQYHKTRNLLILLDSQMQLLGFLAFPLEHDGGIAVPKGKRWAPFSAVFSSPWSWPSIPPYLC